MSFDQDRNVEIFEKFLKTGANKFLQEEFGLSRENLRNRLCSTATDIRRFLIDKKLIEMPSDDNLYLYDIGFKAFLANKHKWADVLAQYKKHRSTVSVITRDSRIVDLMLPTRIKNSLSGIKTIGNLVDEIELKGPSFVRPSFGVHSRTKLQAYLTEHGFEVKLFE